MLKTCTKCGKTLPTTEFCKHKQKKDGLDSWCKICSKLSKQKYYSKEENLQHKRDWDREYYQRTKFTEKRQNYEKNYRKENKLNINQQINIMYSLKRVTNSTLEKSWENLVPYNLQQLKEHLESQFTPKMSWNNYGTYWEIDHIIPQNLFKFSSSEDKDFQVCWSLANLRPISVSENRSRPKDGSDLTKEQIANIISVYDNTIKIKGER